MRRRRSSLAKFHPFFRPPLVKKIKSRKTEKNRPHRCCGEVSVHSSDPRNYTASFFTSQPPPHPPPKNSLFLPLSGCSLFSFHNGLGLRAVGGGGTDGRRGQLESRATLSCLRFSIHAGLSTRSQSMSVSLRLAGEKERSRVAALAFGSTLSFGSGGAPSLPPFFL